MSLKEQMERARSTDVRQGADVRMAKCGEPSPFVPQKASRNGALVFSMAVFVVFFIVGLLAVYAVRDDFDVWAILAGTLLGVLAATSIHIALSWEKVVILRFGEMNRVVGPGLYFTLPIIEHGTMRIDNRTMTTPFFAERTLTADLVPLQIDAVLFWVVRDSERACIEVEDYYAAVSLLAQSSLREAVGRKTLAEVAISREDLDEEIEDDMSKVAANWGVDIIDVRVRDIVIPEELQLQMSLEAQAERESLSRMSVVSVETEIARMLADAAEIYGDPDAAMKLRSMLMQYETVRQSNSSVVTVPTAVSDGFTEGAGSNHGR